VSYCHPLIIEGGNWGDQGNKNKTLLNSMSYYKIFQAFEENRIISELES
jgi:hypothetical protein